MNLDVHFRDNDGVQDGERDFLDDELATTSTWVNESLADAEKRAPAVLIPRASPTVRVHVRRSLSRAPSDEDARRAEERRPLEFDAAPSPISLLDSDTSSSFLESNPLRRDSHLPARIPRRAQPAPSSTPPDPSKLLELIAKGKVLQRSMAKAADEDGWSGQLDPLHAIGIGGDLSSQIQKITGAAVLDDSSASVSEDDPSSWQSILRHASSVSQDAAQIDSRPPQRSDASPCVSEVQGLKVSFDSIGFTREFASRLQQLRDSCVSSRFSPVELAVAHSDVTALFTTTSEDQVEESDSGEPLFSFTPSLQKRAFRLSYSHVVPLPTRDHFLAQQAVLRSSKKQLDFSVVCKTQGTPRRNKQASRSGRSPRILLRGQVAARDVFSSHESRAEPEVVKVYLMVHEDSKFTHGTGAMTKRAGEIAQRVGVLKVKFQVCTMKNAESELKGDGGDTQPLESSLRSSLRGSIVADSSDAPSSSFEASRRGSSRARIPSRRTHNGDKQKRLDRAPLITMQLGVMIDRATAISFPDTQARNGRRGTSFIRFQYTVPHSKSVAALHPVGSFKRSFKRKLIRIGGEQGRSRRSNASVGHVGVFPFETELLLNHGSENKLLVSESCSTLWWVFDGVILLTGSLVMFLRSSKCGFNTSQTHATMYFSDSSRSHWVCFFRRSSTSSPSPLSVKLSSPCYLTVTLTNVCVYLQRKQQAWLGSAAPCCRR